MATKMKGKKVLPLKSSTFSSKMSSTSTAKHQQKAQKEKKVEVRWLQSEAELYLKQWQRRYHQLQGIDDNYHQLSHHFLSNNQLEEYDDWCLTAQRILDLDLELIDNKNNINNNNNKLLVNNNTSYDIFWRKEPKIMFTFDTISKSNDSNVDEEEDENINEEVDQMVDDFESVENICCTNSRDSNRLTPLKSFVNNCNDNESNNEFFRKIIANKKEMMQRNEKQFTLDLKEKLELLSEESSSLTTSQKSKSRSRDRPRVRPPPIRRQMFKCEHSGCQYQSDRNFNFLRHKRTHRKPKSDIIDINTNDNNSGKTKPIITNTSNTSISSDHNISDNEVCDQKQLISSQL